MRGFWRSGIVVAGVLAVALGSARGQQKGLRGPGAELGGFYLVGEPAVQAELKMDDAQKQKAGPFVKRMNTRYDSDVAKLKGLSKDEQAQRIAVLAKPHYDEGMKGLGNFLKPAQIDRFDQILLQERGPMAMLEPEIAGALQLTNAQAKEVAQIVADTRNQQGEAVKAAKNDMKAAAPKIQSLAKESVDKSTAVLKPEQLRTWQKIYGRPISPPAAEAAAPR